MVYDYSGAWKSIVKTATQRSYFITNRLKYVNMTYGLNVGAKSYCIIYGAIKKYHKFCKLAFMAMVLKYSCLALWVTI